MSNIKVVYQITRGTFAYVEVKSDSEEQAVKEMNREFERSYMQERRLRARCTSLDEMKENFGNEPLCQGPSVDEILIEKELKNALRAAIMRLTDKQREIIRLYFWQDMTMKAIAESKHLHISTVSECIAASIKKLRKILDHPEKSA